VERPETQFAWNGTSALAYQVVGAATPDLFYLPGYISNVELNWDHPTMARFLRGLARSRRLIVADPRGLGLSERSTPEDVRPLETMMEDVAVVLDAVGSERTAILATYSGAFIACLFAATYPDRTAGIILYGATANYLWSEETPWEYTEEQWEAYLQEIAQPWSREAALREVREEDPSMADDHDYIEWWYRYISLSVAMGSAVASTRKFMDTDIRPILSSIYTPTLVLVRPEAPGSDPANSRVEAAHFLAGHIAGARLEELPGKDGALWIGDQAPLLRATDAFLGEVHRERAEFERVLATVLFTDIAGSTGKASELGDRAWRELVERHHTGVRTLLGRFRGVEIDTAGDGFFASFDGPARAIRCARAIVEDVRTLGIEVRAGLHTGECQTIDNKLGGVAVNIGARVGSLARPSEVLVSQTVKDLVAGSGLTFEDRGEHVLRGIPDRWRLFAVTS
jgi:class 3 adenylate cyclase